jgi:hypothetical protein
MNVGEYSAVAILFVAPSKLRSNKLIQIVVKWISGIQPNYLFHLRSNPIGDDRCND